MVSIGHAALTLASPNSFPSCCVQSTNISFTRKKKSSGEQLSEGRYGKLPAFPNWLAEKIHITQSLRNRKAKVYLLILFERAPSRDVKQRKRSVFANRVEPKHQEKVIASPKILHSHPKTKKTKNGPLTLHL